MILKWLAFAFIGLICCGSAISQPNNQNLQIEWVDAFTSEEKAMLREWLAGVYGTVEETLGPYPFSLNTYVHLSDRDGEPVPWAHTVRHGEQGVHFYVNSHYPLSKFQEDWTAAHELSHLSIPFLGRDNMWFAEGYASFMQWYLLEKQGVLDSTAVHQKYRERLDRALLRLQSDQTFPELCEQLLKRHDYPTVYWGGAVYFFQINDRLIAEHNTDLFAVIRSYQQRGRLEDETLDELVQSLDTISGTTLFSETLNSFTTLPARDVFSSFNFR